MANYKTCKKCGALLGGDDIAIYRKLVTRNADEFFCIDCLAEYYNTTREVIEERNCTDIDPFKKRTIPRKAPSHLPPLSKGGGLTARHKP